MKSRTACCYALLDHGRCTWCGNPASVMGKDDLWDALEALLCDWNSPSKLDTYDLNQTIAKVARFIKSRS